MSDHDEKKFQCCYKKVPFFVETLKLSYIFARFVTGTKKLYSGPCSESDERTRLVKTSFVKTAAGIIETKHQH
jgi:hypothetical protein